MIVHRIHPENLPICFEKEPCALFPIFPIFYGGCASKYSHLTKNVAWVYNSYRDNFVGFTRDVAINILFSGGQCDVEIKPSQMEV